MLHNKIVCGGSSMCHYVPTGSDRPFTLDGSPDNLDMTLTDYISEFGVSDDYQYIGFKSIYEFGSSNRILLRATYEDGTYEDIQFIGTEFVEDGYLTNQDGWKSGGYYVNQDTTLFVNSSQTHTNSTTHSWINLDGDTITFQSNPSTSPRLGDIFVETSDTLYILTILQRPNEQCDYFLAPDEHYVPTSGATRTVYIRSRNNKSIKRWGAYVSAKESSTTVISEYFNGTGDELSFQLTIPTKERELNVLGVLVVEDEDGMVGSNYGSNATIFHRYSSDITRIFYASAEYFTPYQSFVACMPEETLSPYYSIAPDHYAECQIPIITEGDYSYIDISVIPFGSDLYFGKRIVTDIAGGNHTDFYEVPTRLVQVSNNLTTVDVPIIYNSRTTSSFQYVRTTGVSYSASTGKMTISANTQGGTVNKMICGAYSAVYTVLIPVIQGESTIDGDFPTEPINLDCDGGTFNIDFTSSVDIPNIIISNVPEWLTFTRDGNTIIGVATPNGTDSTRSITLTFTADGFNVSKYLTITQESLDWELLFTTYEFSSDLNYPSSIESEQGVIFGVSDKITDVEATTDADGLRLVVDSPSLQVGASPNRLGNYRTSTVTLYSPFYNSTKTLVFAQRGLQLSISGSSVVSCEDNTITVTGSIAEGWVGLDELTVDSPVDVEIVTNGYYSLTKKDCSFELTVPVNYDKARVFDCEFYVNSKYVGKVEIAQDSCDITVDTPEITFENIGGSADVYIESSLPGIVDIVGDGITVSNDSGDGNGTITITASENEYSVIRTGYVYVIAGEKREAIVIHQVGAEPYLYFNKKYVPVKLGGDIQRVKLYNNIQGTTKWETQ